MRITRFELGKGRKRLSLTQPLQQHRRNGRIAGPLSGFAAPHQPGTAVGRRRQHRRIAALAQSRQLHSQLVAPFDLTGVARLAVVAHGPLHYLPFQALNDGKGWLIEQVRATVPASLARDLVTDGILSGVGSVVVFLPQIVILF